MVKKEGLTIAEVKQKMAYYCAYQDRCHWEVEQKLLEFTLIPEAKDQILIDLLQQNFLNEERFTKSFVRGKFYQKKWGRIKIIQELKKRNIELQLIKIGLKEIDESDYKLTLEKLTEQKINTLKPERESYKKQQKIKSYLLQKGYEYDLIQDTLTSLMR